MISPASSAQDLQKTVTTVVDAVKPSLVRIAVVSADYEQGREVKREMYGSGAIISKDGYVLTNHHVAGHAKRLTCTLADKTEVDAKLIGTDPLTDIAVIKLMPKTDRDFPVAQFGDSSKVKVGDQVFAMGSPLALSQSVTMGIVSNTEVIIPETMKWMEFTLDGEDVGSVVRWIAHDAVIYPGNSGGPLVNIKGEIIGVNEVDIGLGGAIPSNLAHEVADQIISKGKVTRSWIGLAIQPLLKSSGMTKGVLVGGVVEDSPAKKAGFKAGDVLLSIDGKDCTAQFAEEIPIVNHQMMSLPIGQDVDAVVLRDGKNVTIKVKPIDREGAEAKPEEFKQWGFCASNITFIKSKEMKLPHRNGVLISTIRPGGPAEEAKPSLSDDDIIMEVAGKPVNNLIDLRNLTKEITAGKDEPSPTLIGFERDGDHYLTVVKVGITDMSDPGSEVRKAWLPAKTQVLTQDIAEALKLGDITGVRVTSVIPNGTAQKAGLKVGDIITAIDGSSISASRPEDVEVFPAMIRQYKIGSTAELTVIRDGKEQKISVVLIQSPKLTREMKKYRDPNFEFTVREIGMMDRINQKWAEDQAGLYVESVIEGSWASLGDLSSGDLLISVNGKPAKDITEFEGQMKAIAEKKPDTVVFRVKRGIKDIYIELKPAWSN